MHHGADRRAATRRSRLAPATRRLARYSDGRSREICREAATLSLEEHGYLIHVAVAAARGRVPVIAGAGSNATAQAIELSRDADANGAAAVLSVLPYYKKHTP